MDLNLLDYYIWGVLERVIKKATQSNMESLKAAIDETAATMDKAHLINTCKRFYFWVKVDTPAGGG